mmetsp:Transcript_37145/g.116912  ORF Transcript_37145/g.116912 Transcript_37145/m.116912 type:complete len:233 (+) Transcript_37145:46-744(+)
MRHEPPAPPPAPACSCDLVDDGLVQALQLRRPLVHRRVLARPLALVAQLQQRVHLVDVAHHAAVEDEAHEQRLHLLLRDVELLGDEGYADARVGPDQLEQHLRADVLEQVLDVVLDEGVVHDGALVGAQDLLELQDLVALVRPHQVGHGQDLGVVLVRLGLLGVERVDLRLHEHVGEHEVLEALDAPLVPCLIVVLERLEEVRRRVVPHALRHVHLAPALADDPHDAGVGDG